MSGSQRRLIPEERSASFQFFDQVLREDLDRAFVIQFQGRVELLQRPHVLARRSSGTVAAALEYVGPHARIRGPARPYGAADASGCAAARPSTTPCCWPPTS